MPNEPSDTTEPNDHALIEGALAGMDALQDDELPPATDYSQQTPEMDDDPTVGSQTLAQLDASRRPKIKTVCEGCRNSVWFTTPKEVKCYCRVMFLITWSNKEPTQFTGCDGLYIGQE